MRYLWEVVLEARMEKIPLNSIHFTHAPKSSAYMELALACLNQDNMFGETEIEVNTYYRFYSIFKDLYQPEQKEYKQTRDSLTNLILHALAENDVRKGMTKEEYYKKMLVSDIRNGVSGEAVRRIFPQLDRGEQEKLLSGWLRTYQVGSSLAVFIDMVHGLVEDSVVYHNNDCPDEILIYTKMKKTNKAEQRIQSLIDLFLDIHYHVEIYYEYHFGIIDVDCTMRIDEIAMY